MDCQHKLTTLAEIGVEFNENALLKVEQVKTLANQVIAVVSNLDSQQVEEQVIVIDFMNFHHTCNLVSMYVLKNYVFIVLKKH